MKRSLIVAALVVSKPWCFAQQVALPGIAELEYIDAESSIDLRTNLCDRHRELIDGTVDLTNVLQGLNLSVALQVHTNLFRLDSDGAIPSKGYLGLNAVILDELAKRAGFQWRHSFVAFPPLDKNSNYTWTDKLKWQVNHMDIAADNWLRTASRLGAGIAFSEGFYDSSIIIAQRREDPDEEFNTLSFLKPFTYGAWGLIVAAVFFSGLMYWFIAKFDQHGDSNDLNYSIYVSAMAFVGHLKVAPNSAAAKVVAFSLSFWAVLVISTYTANLASILITTKQEQSPIPNFNEAILVGADVCIFANTGQHELVKSQYKGLGFVPKHTDQEVLAGLANGDCKVAATTQERFQEGLLAKDTNGDCRLFYGGRIQSKGSGGFATIIDTSHKCTSLVKNVLDYFFAQMELDGFLERAWENHYKEVGEIQCGSRASTLKTTGSLGIKEMGGLFCFHALLTTLAFLYTLLNFCVSKKRNLNGVVDPTNLRKSTRISRQYQHSSLDDEQSVENTPLANDEEEQALTIPREKEQIKNRFGKSSERSSKSDVEVDSYQLGDNSSFGIRSRPSNPESRRQSATPLIGMTPTSSSRSIDLDPHQPFLLQEICHSSSNQGNSIGNSGAINRELRQQPVTHLASCEFSMESASNLNPREPPPPEEGSNGSFDSQGSSVASSVASSVSSFGSGPKRSDIPRSSRRESGVPLIGARHTSSFMEEQPSRTTRPNHRNKTIRSKESFGLSAL